MSLTPDLLLRELGQPTAATVAPVTGGADTQIWRVGLPDGDFALRLLRPDQRSAARREHAAMEAARAAGLPVPHARATGEVAGRPVMLLEWLPGTTVREAVIGSPHRIPALGRAFGVMQARLHQIPASPEVTRADRSWIDWAAPEPALRACLEEAASGAPRLLHLDYHPLNVLVEGEAVSGVLDWTNATGGDPRADLARTCTLLRFALKARPGVPAPQPEAMARFTRAWWQAYLHEAMEASNCAKCANFAHMGTLAEMSPFLAWAGRVMLRDLAPRLGRADLPWLTEEYLARVQRWTDEMTGRAIRARNIRR